MDDIAQTDSLPARTIETAEIQSLIPHRFPFLFVDRVEILAGGRKAVGTKCVTINEPYFQGHFPGRPIMPGVIVLEALAQAGCVLLCSQGGLKGKLGVFLSIEGAKFRHPVLPGTQLKLHVEILKMGTRAGKLRGEALSGDTVAAEALMTFAFVDR
ncbi:MAG TPA: 3-hydroxyacyl-[acyl-carrier-protein] dehydratase FabZ [Elusimicrobia bacterium]|nr:3-hydroxyacyl-[acyl-carrier-protein] dehydratase FabZ [Elusimicrobiota bacterium]